MKILNFILSIYLVALSCLPCADTEATGITGVAAGVESNHKEHSRDKETDLCSPFCSCSCCGVHIMNFTAVNYPDIKVYSGIVIKPVTAYKSNLASTFSGSIWQPPQLI